LTGKLLFSDEDSMAVILLRSCRCICSAFIQPIRQWSSGTVLHRVPQRVVHSRVVAFHSSWHIWGKYFRFFIKRLVSGSRAQLSLLCVEMHR